MKLAHGVEHAAGQVAPGGLVGKGVCRRDAHLDAAVRVHVQRVHDPGGQQVGTPVGRRQDVLVLARPGQGIAAGGGVLRDGLHGAGVLHGEKRPAVLQGAPGQNGADQVCGPGQVGLGELDRIGLRQEGVLPELVVHDPFHGRERAEAGPPVAELADGPEVLGAGPDGGAVGERDPVAGLHTLLVDADDRVRQAVGADDHVADLQVADGPPTGGGEHGLVQGQGLARSRAGLHQGQGRGGLDGLDLLRGVRDGGVRYVLRAGAGGQCGPVLVHVAQGVGQPQVQVGAADLGQDLGRYHRLDLVVHGGVLVQGDVVFFQAAHHPAGAVGPDVGYDPVLHGELGDEVLHHDVGDDAVGLDLPALRRPADLPVQAVVLQVVVHGVVVHEVPKALQVAGQGGQLRAGALDDLLVEAVAGLGQLVDHGHLFRGGGSAVLDGEDEHVEAGGELADGLLHTGAEAVGIHDRLFFFFNLGGVYGNPDPDLLVGAVGLGLSGDDLGLGGQVEVLDVLPDFRGDDEEREVVDLHVLVIVRPVLQVGVQAGRVSVHVVAGILRVAEHAAARVAVARENPFVEELGRAGDVGHGGRRTREGHDGRLVVVIYDDGHSMGSFQFSGRPLPSRVSGEGPFNFLRGITARLPGCFPDWGRPPQAFRRRFRQDRDPPWRRPPRRPWPRAGRPGWHPR